MGLLRTAAKVGVASSVHGRVQRRQRERWAAQDAAAHRPPPAPPPAQPVATAPPAPPAPANDIGNKLANLKKLGELRDAGVLTDAEFEVQKARILHT